MAINEIHVNDVGTIFILTIYDENSSIVDISTAATLQISFKKPDGTVLDKVASLYTNGTDGKLKYQTIAGDIDQVGPWQIQSWIDLDSVKFYSDISKFTVYRNLSCA